MAHAYQGAARAAVPRYRWLLPPVHPQLQRSSPLLCPSSRRTTIQLAVGVQQQRRSTRSRKPWPAGLSSSCPTLRMPFVVHTDASGFAVGAVLQQDQGTGPAADRVPVEEDARCRDALSRARARAAGHHPCADDLAPLPGRSASSSCARITSRSSIFKTQPQLSGRQSRWKDIIGAVRLRHRVRRREGQRRGGWSLSPLRPYAQLGRCWAEPARGLCCSCLFRASAAARSPPSWTTSRMHTRQTPSTWPN